MREILSLAVAGAAGTLSRWALSGWTYRLLGDRFPYGTLAVNVLGCFLLGFLMHVALATEIIPADWRPPLTVGFFGAFTTFSTFGYETMRYMEDGAWWPALANIGANLALGLAAVFIGLFSARTLVGGS